MPRNDPAANRDRNFILQQGLDEPDTVNGGGIASALLFQPRLVGLIVLAGTFSRSPAVFAMLATLLWFGALVPRLNPFDIAYNHSLGLRPGAPRLGQAPMPRRFAQSMAATFAMAIAWGMVSGAWITASVIHAVLLAAVAALIFGRFCLGSFVYHLLRGRVRFAIGTLPWSGRRDGACLIAPRPSV